MIAPGAKSKNKSPYANVLFSGFAPSATNSNQPVSLLPPTPQDLEVTKLFLLKESSNSSDTSEDHGIKTINKVTIIVTGLELMLSLLLMISCKTISNQ